MTAGVEESTACDERAGVEESTASGSARGLESTVGFGIERPTTRHRVEVEESTDSEV